MPFSFNPSPEQYARLFAQWQSEEEARIQAQAAQSASTAFPATSTKRLLAIFLVLFLFIKIVQLCHKRAVVRRRQARQEMYKQHRQDVENVPVGDGGVSSMWDDDEFCQDVKIPTAGVVRGEE